MMRSSALLLASALFASSASADESGTLIVKVTSLRSDRGQVVACLYRSEDGFPKDERRAWRRESAPIVRGAAELRFAGVPPGAYAVLAFHDENGNGALERGFLGIPKEGVALSNNARGHLGPPKYKDARFEMKAAEQTMVIQAVYL
jgi:uncharacterized protein (DUF2141 family)